MNCFFCNGTLGNSTTTHVVDIEDRAIIIRGVPCLKCDQCAEISYTGTTFERLESMIDTLKNSLLEVTIINYVDNVA